MHPTVPKLLEGALHVVDTVVLPRLNATPYELHEVQMLRDTLQQLARRWELEYPVLLRERGELTRLLRQAQRTLASLPPPVADDATLALAGDIATALAEQDVPPPTPYRTTSSLVDGNCALRELECRLIDVLEAAESRGGHDGVRRLRRAVRARLRRQLDRDRECYEGDIRGTLRTLMDAG